jgi:hypothetical protein
MSGREAKDLFLQLCVPVVLYVVVCSSWQLRCYDRPPACAAVHEKLTNFLLIVNISH